jgi:putative FmdB family regulatory protein
MPIYEYRCKKCGKEFELFQKISEPAVKTCTFCKGPANRLISLSTFHLKGGGWYVTDYGGKKAPTTTEKKKEDAVTPAPASSETTTKTTTTKTESSPD